MSNILSIPDFPRQKLARGSKTKKWATKCVDACEGVIADDSNGVRTTLANKEENYRLYAGYTDTKSVEKQFNPLDLKSGTLPADYQNYGIEIPKFNLLIGEESNRKFQYRLRSVNDDAYSERENKQRDDVRALLVENIKKQSIDEQDFNNRVQKIQKYYKYEYQDMQELMGTRILKYLEKELDTETEFRDGFKDVLLVAEELYDIDIIGGEPVVRRLNPKNVFTVRGGKSSYIEDSEIICHVCYRSLSKVIDDYHDELTSAQITALEDKIRTAYGGYGNDHRLPQGITGPIESSELNEDVILLDDNNNLLSAHRGGGYFDGDGNIRELKVRWRSMRKMGFVTYIDENGDEQQLEHPVDERYKINEAKGEKIKWEWLGEWWEGIKLADDIYVKMRPRPVQFTY